MQDNRPPSPTGNHDTVEEEAPHHPTGLAGRTPRMTEVERDTMRAERRAQAVAAKRAQAAAARESRAEGTTDAEPNSRHARQIARSQRREAKMMRRKGLASGATPAEAPRAQQQRRSWLRASALLFVGLPTLLVALYYILLAAPQYAVEVRFAVRSPSTTGASSSASVLSAVTGAPSALSGITDSYIVMDFVQSREVIDEMERRIGFRAIYGRSQADFWAKLKQDRQIEDIVKYWRSMIRVNFDTISQIVSYEVRAFTPEDAKRVAETLLQISEEQVNELSARARTDTVKSAETEVARMENRVRAVRLSIRQFREKYGDFDPIKTADAQMVIQSRLEDELSKARAEIRTLSSYMSPSAPSIDVVRNKIKALERQIEEERRKLAKVGPAVGTSGSTESLTRIVAQYEALLVEREFADKALVSALGSLESARADAARQQRYTAAFVRPQLPQLALYPQRLINTLVVLAMSLIIWALGVLLIYAIRDHAN